MSERVMSLECLQFCCFIHEVHFQESGVVGVKGEVAGIKLICRWEGREVGM